MCQLVCQLGAHSRSSNGPGLQASLTLPWQPVSLLPEAPSTQWEGCQSMQTSAAHPEGSTLLFLDVVVMVMTPRARVRPD